MSIDTGLSVATHGYEVDADAVPAPTVPTSVSAAAGDTQVVLTVDAASETDVVYARYRTYPNGDWSDESESFKRTGDGAITVTGLTNGTTYDFAVYAKSNALTSDWLMARATPVGSEDAPSDVLTNLVYPRTRGPWAVIWLSAQDPWSFERMKILAQKLGRLR